MGIQGQVRSRDGRPLAEARVYYEDAPVPVPEIAALTDEEGRFHLSAPARGVYRLGAAMDGYESSSATVDVGPERSVHADITLVPTPG